SSEVSANRVGRYRVRRMRRAAAAHSGGEAERYYRGLNGQRVRVGIEATGHACWFEGLLAELKCELWVGDPAQIRAKRVRKHKNDREDARLLCKLLVEDRFPRVWVPSAENRDVRQLLWHRHRLVQMRTGVMNHLQAIALNEGVRRRKGLWSQRGREQLESLTLANWATRRRRDLLDLLDRLNPRIEELSEAIEPEAVQRPEVKRRMTHPGVGALTALAFVLIIGFPGRQADRQLSGAGSLRGLQCRSPAGWDISASQGTLCYVSCWWRPRRPSSASTPSGDVSSCTWRCVATARSPRWRWHASSPSAS